MTDGATIWKTLLGASLGSAIVQGIFSYVAERRKRTAHATHLAMRLAVLLDAFGLACRDMIDRNSYAETLDSEYPNWERLPELPPYPEDSEGWVSLRRVLAMRCLRLRSNAVASETLLKVTVEFSEDDLGDTLDEQAAMLGLDAWRLAEDLQRTYRLGRTGGDDAYRLEAARERARKSILARRQRQGRPQLTIMPIGLTRFAGAVPHRRRWPREAKRGTVEERGANMRGIGSCVSRCRQPWLIGSLNRELPQIRNVVCNALIRLLISNKQNPY